MAGNNELVHLKRQIETLSLEPEKAQELRSKPKSDPQRKILETEKRLNDERQSLKKMQKLRCKTQRQLAEMQTERGETEYIINHVLKLWEADPRVADLYRRLKHAKAVNANLRSRIAAAEKAQLVKNVKEP